MNFFREELEEIANELLEHIATSNENKPNYSNSDFMNCIIIFQTALLDKLYDNQDYDNMSFEDRLKMANSCGEELRKLIHTFTGLDTHKVEEFI